ncbi:MAG: hypothetical protein H0T51_24635 [Pirellulales bacterium]|nr:hypothetical protein [Pirellulales bacterium]
MAGFQAPHDTEAGVSFTDEQSAWLDKLAEHIAMSLAIKVDVFHDGCSGRRGHLGKSHELFGDRLSTIIIELNKALTA